MLVGGARRQRPDREAHGGRGIVTQRIARQERVQHRACAGGVARREGEPRGVETSALPRRGERLDRARGVAGEQQRPRPCDRDIARCGRRHVRDELAHRGGIARHPRLPHAQPRIDARELAARARRRKRESGTVGLSRGIEGHAGAYGEQRDARGGRTGACHLEMRGGVGEAADAELRLRQDRERLTVEIVEQPRLPSEQRPRVLEPPGVHLRLGAFHDQKRVGIRVAPCRGEQRLGGVPGASRQAERVGAVRGGVIGDRGLGPAQ